MTEMFTCPRRAEQGLDQDDSPIRYSGTNLDSFKSGHGLIGQHHGCSFCGSLSADEFMRLVNEGAEIGPTDKSYKFYVDGHKAKFYTQHLAPDQGWEFDKLWKGKQINWGYPGHPYVPLYIPGPSQAARNSN